MNIVEKGINDIKAYDKNPRKNDDSIESVAKSIKEFGFKVPCIIDTNNVIVSGHTRVEAAKLLGLTTIPCIIADDLSEEQIKAFRIADNKVSELSEWNYFKLASEISEIEGLDMIDFGFEENEIESLKGLFGNITDLPDIDENIESEDIHQTPVVASVYQPNFTPSESKKQVTDEQIKKAEDNKRIDITSKQVNTIVCPYCNKEFKYD